MDEMPKKPKKDPFEVPAWMVTFGDMNTLLLTFFVFLITTMTTDAKKFDLVLSAFQDAIGVMEGGRSINLTNEELMNMGNRPEALGEGSDIVRPKEKLETLLGWLAENTKGKVETREDERGLVLLLTDRTLFNAGEAQLIPEAVPILQRIAEFLNNVVPEHDIRIEGHTDDRPSEGSVFTNNMELSVARASGVFDQLIRDGVTPQRLSVAGYGEFRPIVSNDTEENRARNRRVEIVVLWEKSERGEQEVKQNGG